MKTKILLAEDELTLATLIAEGLSDEGFEVVLAQDGVQALELFFREMPDLVLLDVTMPRKDGFGVMETIREAKSDVPVLFITAKIQPKDAVKGLDLGAKDYIRKPFHLQELVSRIRTHLGIRSHKTTQHLEASIQLGHLELDFQRLTLKTPVKDQKLTFREAELLAVLAKHRNEIVKREVLFLEVWKEEEHYDSRTLDVFISRLRKYLQADPSIQLINIRGIGYRLTLGPQN